MAPNKRPLSPSPLNETEFVHKKLKQDDQASPELTLADYTVKNSASKRQKRAQKDAKKNCATNEPDFQANPAKQLSQAALRLAGAQVTSEKKQSKTLSSKSETKDQTTQVKKTPFQAQKKATQVKKWTSKQPAKQKFSDQPEEILDKICQSLDRSSRLGLKGLQSLSLTSWKCRRIAVPYIYAFLSLDLHRKDHRDSVRTILRYASAYAKQLKIEVYPGVAEDTFLSTLRFIKPRTENRLALIFTPGSGLTKDGITRLNNSLKQIMDIQFPDMDDNSKTVKDIRVTFFGRVQIVSDSGDDLAASFEPGTPLECLKKRFSSFHNKSRIENLTISALARRTYRARRVYAFFKALGYHHDLARVTNLRFIGVDFGLIESGIYEKLDLPTLRSLQVVGCVHANQPLHELGSSGQLTNLTTLEYLRNRNYRDEESCHVLANFLLAVPSVENLSLETSNKKMVDLDTLLAHHGTNLRKLHVKSATGDLNTEELVTICTLCPNVEDIELRASFVAEPFVLGNFPKDFESQTFTMAEEVTKLRELTTLKIFVPPIQRGDLQAPNFAGYEASRDRREVILHRIYTIFNQARGSAGWTLQYISIAEEPASYSRGYVARESPYFRFKKEAE